MKIIAIVLPLILTKGLSAHSQDCNITIKYKGSDLVIEQKCDNFAEQGLFPGPKIKTGSTYVSLTLDKQSKANLALLAKKSLTWGQINYEKNFSFKKLLGEVSAEAQTLYRIESSPSDITTNSYNNLEIIFEAADRNNYRMTIYGDMRTNNYYTITTSKGKKVVARKSTLNIDFPGSPLLTFQTEQEIKNFILLLEKQNENLDAIFK